MKQPNACLCGCGQMTKGGIFCPGHDAKYYKAQGIKPHCHGAPLVGNNQPKLCRCGCGEWTKGGTYRPGHDTKHFSRMLGMARHEAKINDRSAVEVTERVLGQSRLEPMGSLRETWPGAFTPKFSCVDGPQFKSVQEEIDFLRAENARLRA